MLLQTLAGKSRSDSGLKVQMTALAAHGNLPISTMSLAIRLMVEHFHCDVTRFSCPQLRNIPVLSGLADMCVLI